MADAEGKCPGILPGQNPNSNKLANRPDLPTYYTPLGYPFLWYAGNGVVKGVCWRRHDGPSRQRMAKDRTPAIQCHSTASLFTRCISIIP
jgi:hypothetical protein